jgi:hypothetical protein
MNSQFGKICNGAEASEALSQDTPFLPLRRIVCCQAPTDCLAIAYNIVRSKPFEILSLSLSIPTECQCSGRDRGAKTCAPLIQQKDLNGNQLLTVFTKRRHRTQNDNTHTRSATT